MMHYSPKQIDRNEHREHETLNLATERRNWSNDKMTDEQYKQTCNKTIDKHYSWSCMINYTDEILVWKISYSI